ncbi:MAG: carboxymuconolactone decarboxylase family protein [Betaproteobacteria bacterium]|nr:carboxymuconolactone decarboxylase family protein [Betaproteobacteria bacterium]
MPIPVAHRNVHHYVPEAKLDAMQDFEHSPLFSERERAALAYAEVMTRASGKADETLMAKLKRHFDEDAIIELTALIAFQNLSSKFNATLGVPPQGFCRRETRV